MPIKKASIKGLRKSRANTIVNRAQRTALKKAIKTVSVETVNEVFSIIDKAVKNNLISKARGSRLKSRLARQTGATPASKPKTAATKPASKKSAAKKTPAKKTAPAKATKSKTE